ncbi:hypothetical protein ACJJTC_002006 [Scirpophaga incertulas]
MSKLLRTPPEHTIHHVSSEGDISTLHAVTPTKYEHVGRKPKRIRDQDHTFSLLRLEILQLKEQGAAIQATNTEMEKSLNFMSQQYEDLQEKLLRMEQERREDLNYIASLENKVDNLQKKLKFTVIEFRNLPCEVESVRNETQQDLCKLIQKTCKVIQADIDQCEIKDIFRVKMKTGADTVVADLTSVLAKNRILDAVRHHNKTNPTHKLSTQAIGLPGPARPIYISESLTNKDRKLYGQARAKAKELDYKFCWISNGRVYLRKSQGGPRLEIKNETDFTSLMKE